MKKTEGATEAHARVGWGKHLRRDGKRLANKASRKQAKLTIRKAEVARG